MNTASAGACLMVAAIGLVIRDLRPNSNEWRFWFWAGITLAAADFAFVLS